MKTSPFGLVYLLHFKEPYPGGKRPRHYVGYTENFSRRMELHRTGRSRSRLMSALAAAGIGFEVARSWAEPREFERWLKRQKNTRRYCPLCCSRPRDPRGPRAAAGSHSTASHESGRPRSSPDKQDRPPPRPPNPRTRPGARRGTRRRRPRRSAPAGPCQRSRDTLRRLSLEFLEPTAQQPVRWRGSALPLADRYRMHTQQLGEGPLSKSQPLTNHPDPLPSHCGCVGCINHNDFKISHRLMICKRLVSSAKLLACVLAYS